MALSAASVPWAAATYTNWGAPVTSPAANTRGLVVRSSSSRTRAPRSSSSCGLGELRGEALDPPVDRDVVDLDPALGQELLDDVPVGETEPQVPADRQGDDF